ncbi:MAG: hypothetical protein ACK44D_04900 [Bacteroidia bacterium]
MKIKPTYVAALALLYCTALVSCKKDELTSKEGGSYVDACRPTEFSIFGAQDYLYKFVHDSLKRLVEINDGSKLTKFVYDQQGYLSSIQVYENNILKELKEYNYMDGKPVIEKSYFVNDSIKQIWEIGKYEYQNGKISRKNFYSVNSADSQERYIVYIDYTVDRNDNITSETYYYPDSNSVFSKSHSYTYTYSEYPTSTGINYVLFDNSDLVQNRFLPKTLTTQNQLGSSLLTFNYQTINAKGYPTSFNGLMSNGSYTFNASYNCD